MQRTSLSTPRSATQQQLASSSLPLMTEEGEASYGNLKQVVLPLNQVGQHVEAAERYIQIATTAERLHGVSMYISASGTGQFLKKSEKSNLLELMIVAKAAKLNECETLIPSLTLRSFESIWTFQSGRKLQLPFLENILLAVEKKKLLLTMTTCYHNKMIMKYSSISCSLYAIEEMDELYGIKEELEFCRVCNLPMYQKDDPQKFMVFACRACGLEEPRDYLYTLESKRINGIPVLPKVKDQGNRGTCVPTALLTVLETEIKTEKAELNEVFNEELSLEDFLLEYRERMGIEYERDSPLLDFKDHRTNILIEIMLEAGVALKDNAEGNKCFKARKVRSLKNQSFADLAGHILKGHPLKIKMPITNKFFKVRRGRKGSQMYIARPRTTDAYKLNGLPMWHSVVLVGFGRKEGVEYFRYMNSHGTEFDDEGFGDLRASEIKEALVVKI